MNYEGAVVRWLVSVVIDGDISVRCGGRSLRIRKKVRVRAKKEVEAKVYELFGGRDEIKKVGSGGWGRKER